jgi:predicted aspartyl protease
MRFAVRAATLAAAFALAGAGPQDDQLGAIAAAAGHVALVHVRATASRLDEGRTIETSFDQLGTSQLLERCIAGVCGGTWFDGERRWTFGLNEVPLPEAVDDATLTERTLAAIESYAFAEPAFRAGGGVAAPVSAGRWRVRAHDGAELIAVLDPASRAVRRVETPAGSVVAEFAREVRAGGGRFALDRRGPLESGPLDAAAPASGPLRPPPGPAVTVTPGGLPLPLAAGPVPIVACTVGGRAERCLLDTGATPSAVTLGVAEALGLEPHGELEIAGLGRFATGFIESGPLTLGPARFARARFAVIPPAAALRFDVVVGSDLLARVRVVLDGARRIATILPPGGTAAGTAVGLTFRAGSPFVAATLGDRPHAALLDTGDAAVVSLGIADYRTGPQWPVVGRGEALGVAGADDTLTVQLPAFAVGTLAVGPARATVRRTQPAPHVGIGLWTRFRLDLDEATERISFSSP